MSASAGAAPPSPLAVPAAAPGGRREGEEGGCRRNGFKGKDVRTRGQNSGDAGEKELICSKVRKLQSRAGGGKRGERKELELIHSPRLAEIKSKAESRRRI